MIILGVLSFNSEMYGNFLRFTNKIKGVKTELSSTTLAMGKIQGVVGLIVGLIFLYLTLKVMPW